MANTMRHGSALLTGVCQLKVITFGFAIVPVVTRTTQPGSTSHFALFNFTSLFIGSFLGLMPGKNRFFDSHIFSRTIIADIYAAGQRFYGIRPNDW
jgi:hypothetical protein